MIYMVVYSSCLFDEAHHVLSKVALVALQYGQQLCQNPRSKQKYCANVLILPTLVLAIFSTGDRIQ
jgi:hypothetical protein